MDWFTNILMILTVIGSAYAVIFTTAKINTNDERGKKISSLLKYSSYLYLTLVLILIVLVSKNGL